MNTFAIRTMRPVTLLAALALALSGCAEAGDTGDGVPSEEDPDAMEPGIEVDARPEEVGGPAVSAERGAPVGTAVLSPTENSDVRGTVTFVPSSEGIRVAAAVRGLSPGEHGFHIHEEGDCSAADAGSAGGHFAPEGSPHGAPSDPADERHAGDMGNLEAGEDGVAEYERMDEVMTIRERGPETILGKAVIVHEGRDDLTSQPGGDAGPRRACGVITLQGSTEVMGSESGEM